MRSLKKLVIKKVYYQKMLNNNKGSMRSHKCVLTMKVKVNKGI